MLETDGPTDARRLWLQLVEAEARCRQLESRLMQLCDSRSWRLTAPLRAMVGHFAGRRRATSPRPALSGPANPLAPGYSSPSWQTLLAQACERQGLPRWTGAGDGGARYLVDVTELALEDLGAGVQRITRNWLVELLLEPPAHHVVEPVRLASDGSYVLARCFLARFLGLQAEELGPDLVFAPRSGDIFVGLDFCRDRVAQLGPALARLNQAGVQLSLVVPDVLPLQHPEWFPPGIAANFEGWLQLLSRHAQRALCISRDCAANLQAALEARQLDHPGLQLVVVPLGSDLRPVPLLPWMPARQAGVPRMLMVGTLEPRKGHAQVLDAFDLLNAGSGAVELFIVGHPGWMTGELARRIRGHALFGTRLHWWDDADDSTLAAAYWNCDLLVMASLGEGYGLPIGEAARAGCALLLRDLPVFREVAGDSARYFSGLSGHALAAAVQDWIACPAGVPARDGGQRNWPSWQASAAAMKNETMPGPAMSADPPVQNLLAASPAAADPP